ncbi:MAG: sulfotransferase family 2 domain-containing protein [Phycisphaerales bacterium]
MLINRERRFAFVHIQKTGGTAVREALRTVPGTVDLGRTHKHRWLQDAGVPEGYFVFSFVRNPWDRLVSWWNHHQTATPETAWHAWMTREGIEGFGDWLRRDPYVRLVNGGARGVRVPQLAYLCDARTGRRADFVGRYETLEDDFRRVCDRIGVEAPTLGHVRPKGTLPHGAYAAYYDAGLRDLVAAWYDCDIEAFGYRFEGGLRAAG